MDPDLPKVLRDAGVVVLNGHIVGIGPISDLRREFGNLPARNDRNAGILLPGFVNAHTHLELSYQSSANLNSTHFTQWVSALIAGYPKPDQLKGVIRSAVQKGARDSLRSGVTTLGDITRHAAITRDELARISHARGSPHVVSYGEVVGLGKMRDRLEPLLQSALSPAGPAPARVHSAMQPQLVVGLSPHAPYTVEGPSLQNIVRQAIIRRAPLCMHLAELAEEAEFLGDLSGPLGREWDLMLKMDVLDDKIPLFGGGPIRWAQRYGLLVYNRSTPPERDLPVLLAHVNYCDNAELAALAAAQVSVAYCPRTHAYFRHPPHRYRDMLAHGINVCLGTDSLASNPDLSVLKEAQVLRRRDQLDAYSALEMITRRGAIALGRESHAGTLIRGKSADLLFFSTDPKGAGDEQLLERIVNEAPEPGNVWVSGRLVKGNT